MVNSNLLEVTVAKHSANESVNNAERKADFWIFGGIFQTSWLEVLPATHIENISIDAKADGNFKANITTNGYAAKYVNTGYIHNANGNVLGNK